jgi:phosphatidylglycerol:prolipoprotein diacylglycerol transferase
MLQELFRIPIPSFLRWLLPFLPTELPLYGYGLMLVIGFIIATQFGRRLCRHVRINPDVFANAGMIALISGIVGARLSHIFENWSVYTNPNRSFDANFWDAINITSGGLTFYGGLLLGTPITIAYTLYKKAPLRIGMDVIAPCILIGLGFGRIGCFLNGCCYGATCDAPYAVTFPYHSPAYLDDAHDRALPKELPPELLTTTKSGTTRLLTPAEIRRDHPELKPLAREQRSAPHHPAQLYSAFNALLLAALLAAYFTLPHIPGRVFALMCILEGATRFLLELLRVEPPVVTIGSIGFSLSMLIGLGLVVCGAVLWFVFGTLGDRAGDAPIGTSNLATA